MAETCETCRFSRTTKVDHDTFETICRRYPPKDDIRVFLDDWCGEYQPRVEPKPELAREPGWYWVMLADGQEFRWVCAELSGGCWYGPNDELGEDVRGIGPRLEPPAQ